MFDGLFLLICHCTLSIFFPFNILAGLRIKSCVSPYSLDDFSFSSTDTNTEFVEHIQLCMQRLRYRGLDRTP